MNVPSVPVLSEFQYRISSIFGYSVRYLVRDLAPCLLRLDPTLSRTTSNGSGRTRAGLHRSHATYGNGEFLQWLLDRGITPYMRTRDSALRKNNPGYGPERFTYLPESNTYGCPAGELLNYVGFERSQSRPCLYREREALRSLLTESTMYDRTLRISRHSHPRVGTTTSTGLGEHAEFARAQRQRKKVEALFAELKKQIGLRRLRLAEAEVRARAVLSGGGCAEHQATGSFPRQRQHRRLSPPKIKKNKTQPHHSSPHKSGPSTEFFNSHACLQQPIVSPKLPPVVTSLATHTLLRYVVGLAVGCYVLLQARKPDRWFGQDVCPSYVLIGQGARKLAHILRAALERMRGKHSVLVDQPSLEYQQTCPSTEPWIAS